LRLIKREQTLDKESHLIDCKFELNGKAISTLWCGAKRFPAYSGLKGNVNRRISACVAGSGPIPPGTYYIFDRQSGGLLGPLRDLFSNKDEWFALYAIDEKVDDETFCENVKRGQFRLHPSGPLGISQGCITINNASDYQILRAMLKKTKQEKVPGSELLAYGKVVVR